MINNWRGQIIFLARGGLWREMVEQEIFISNTFHGVDIGNFRFFNATKIFNYAE